MGIIDDVKANLARLDGCAGPHRLSLMEDGKRDAAGLRLLGRKYHCCACGGVMDAVAALWYCRGLAHGSARAFIPEELAPKTSAAP